MNENRNLYFATENIFPLPTIAINTTQNVTIEYELASVRERIIAFLMDYFIIIGGIILSIFLVSIISRDQFTEYFIYFFIIPFYVFYSLTSEVIGNGQSLGKKALGIKIIKLNGKEPTTSDYMMRWAFRLIDIYVSLGMVASALISSGNKGQRLGDLIANTTVVRLRPSRTVSLREILSIKTLMDYQPVYTNVRLLREEEMILIKQVIERFSKYKNEVHHEALNRIAIATAHKLSVEEPKDKLEFLRTLLKDYVVLSR